MSAFLAMVEPTEGGVLLSVRLQPKASKNEVAGTLGDFLKVKVSAAPVEGAANEACQEVLARAFRVAKSQVEIVSGFKSRQKKVFLSGMDIGRAETRLAELLKRNA